MTYEAIMLPMLEMAVPHVRYVEEVVYLDVEYGEIGLM